MKQVLLSFIIFFFLFPVSALAQSDIEQEYDYLRSYQDYVFARDQYDKSHSSYRLARSQYLQAGTLVSESQAKDATIDMLEKRDDVIIYYLRAVRMRLVENTLVSETQKIGLLERLDSEISWFVSHKERIRSAGDLDALVEDSDEAKEKFVQSELVVYEILMTLGDVKVDQLRRELDDLVERARVKSAEIQREGDLDVTIVARWITDIKNRITRSFDKGLEVESDIQSLYTGRRRSNSEFYTQTITKLQESMQLIQDGNNFMKEVIKVFKGE